MEWSQGGPTITLGIELCNYWYATFVSLEFWIKQKYRTFFLLFSVTFILFLPIIKEKGLGFSY